MKNNLSIKEMTLVGMCAAIMAIFSQLSIPLPFTTVPVTLQIFGVVVIATIVGKKIATLSLVIFTLIGAIGLPVFSNFTGGPGILFGATGGYIIGFIIMAFIVGAAASKDNKTILFIGAYVGMLVDYVFGVIQLKIILGLTFQQALAGGFYPFVIKDIIIIPLAVIVALVVKKSVGRYLVNPNANA